jgi:amidase
MSVFSLNAKIGNPVTADTVEKLCSQLGVSIEKEHEDDYKRLLAVFHDSIPLLTGMSISNESKRDNNPCRQPDEVQLYL